jgi:hypothetical protein
MATNHRQSTASPHDVSTTGAHAEGFGERVIDRLRQAVCGLHGHDTFVQFEQDRMFLRCVSCGHETAGWALKDIPAPAPIAAAREDVHRPALARPQFISERRIA